jgi:purine-nucleoside/S-methyl-5'-thioadenosine phosphorylase / adenosine deaminase
LPRESCRHAFVRRVPGIDVSYDKMEVLARLDAVHRQVRDSLGLEQTAFLTAEQVHGKKVTVIDSPISGDRCFDACDGLVTNQRDVCLGIYVADCCAVFFLDPIRAAIGLVHSGKKGTGLGIVSEAITTMKERFDSKVSQLIVQLSPCIRPPHYEVDFAAEIVRQCRDAGVQNVRDCNICTACDLEHYYSYRAEKGRTGRMLALFALA